jgi:hypothetical protein
MICHLFGLKITGTVFSGLASKPMVTVFSNLSSKPVVTVLSGLALKSVAAVSFGLTLKSVAMVSLGLASKPVVVFLVEPQNQGGGGFSGLGLKIGNYDLVFWVSKSPRLFLGLGIKIKQSMVCRLCHKTNGRSTV